MFILRMVMFMMIRLGYVSISKTLNDITTSSSYSVTNFFKEKDYQKLSNIIKSNLNSLIEILKYNQKNDIHFYRISSNLIPLATYPDISFDYQKKYLSNYEEIKKIIHENQMRIDMHPSQYCVLNSVRKEVVSSSIEIIKYHYNLLKEMGITPKIIILHIGSNTFGKQNSLTRFIHNFKKLSKELQEMIVIENDDKVFQIEDCLYLSNELKIPVVLDYHHFLCNNTGKKIEDYLEDIFQTWNYTSIRPKIHFSSSKNKKEFRAHHEFIDVDEFINFLEILGKYSYDVDIMLEAKGKDEALFRLVRQLKYKTNYEFLDGTSFKI